MQKVILRFLDNFQSAGGVAGTLALSIAITLCVVYWRDPANNQDIQKALIYALTSILGFYFGTSSAKGAAASGDQSGNPKPTQP
jgi:hypothetical protein